MSETSATPSADAIYVMGMPDDVGAVSDLEPDDTLRGPISDLVARLRPTSVKVVDLHRQVEQFMQQMMTLLSTTPTQVGDFECTQLEVSAGITASGQLTLYGVASAQAGIQGGLKFIFKKRPVTPEDKPVV